MTLIAPLHKAFRKFHFTLKPTEYIVFLFTSDAVANSAQDEQNIYAVKTFKEIRKARLLELPPSRRVTLKAHDTSFELPHRSLLEAHAAVAEILDLTGIGEYIENSLREREELLCLAGDGSTDVRALLLCY